MNFKTKKILLTIADIAILLLALCWVIWLLVYYVQSIDGAILIISKYNIFERNYLVPLQILGISAFSTIFSVRTYGRLRRQNLIGRKYIILLFLHTVPFWYIAVMHITDLLHYRYIY